MDDDVRSRRTAILYDWSRREVPVAAGIFVVIVVLFDVLTVASGTALPLGYLLSDVIQCVVWATVALLVWRRVTSNAATPWLWSLAVVVSTWALTYQYRVDPTGAVIGVLIMLVALTGSLTLFWRPFLVAAVPMAALSIAAFVAVVPDDAANWSIVYLTGLGASAGLLAARRVSSLSAARAAIFADELATTDALTGLLNRHGLNLSAPLMTALAARSDRPLFAVFVDVGGLKRVNDEFGHHVGDRVLQRTADAVQRAARSGDLVVRWGGDELLIVGVGERPDADELERRIRQHLDLGGLEGQWSGELHIGTWADDERQLEPLIRHADEDLYRRRGA